jgi:hypothetical protein
MFSAVNINRREGSKLSLRRDFYKFSQRYLSKRMFSAVNINSREGSKGRFSRGIIFPSTLLLIPMIKAKAGQLIDRLLKYLYKEITN